ncbi:MAG: DNA mismatch repair endonuclease MutL [Bacteroidaceae bacterium]|nr:DNA mismatch repair endonuclease MutL [Bacteroidaceae bacterium]
MADIIHLLPDSVANQIAAGEVIQRPASVVKELLENAIDAGAHRIDVLLVDAGRTSIQVIDDGKGMSETDARIAFERHATSKIAQASDLFSLTTMGFRGEALPSIAAVAQVTLRTHAADSELGTCLTIEGGKVTSQELDNCPVGSNFMVQNLFFNVPARRKFLKSTQTELFNVMQEFERVALVSPDIHFTFTHNEHLLNTLLPEPRKQRIATIFGKKLSEQLLSVDVETTLCSLHGYVGKPESAKKKGARQYFFINGRYMRHPYFHKAVQEAFEGLIQPLEQVPYFLYMEVDPATIDVNIHPTKTEIKFENEVAIWQIILAATKEALGRFNAIPTIDFDTEGRPKEMPVYNQTIEKPATASPPRPVTSTGYNPFKEPSAYHNTPKDWKALYEGVTNTQQQSQDTLPLSRAEDLVSSELERSVQHYQYRGQYIITEVRSGLMLIDQRRAHTRILYNKYREMLESRTGPSQGLLFPELVQIPMSDVPLVEDMQQDLKALGFEVSSLGGGSYSIQGMPAGLEGVEPKQLFMDLVETSKTKGQDIEGEIHHRIALTLALKSAISVGEVLTQQEMENLVDELFQQQEPNYTPDGKVIVVIYPHDNLEKLFK